MGTHRTASAFRQLRQLIVTGGLAPGTRLVETELARRLGFSRTPIRGALRLLLREGYALELGGQRVRLVVAPLTIQDARELFEIVGVIEGLGARAAAELADRQRLRLTAELTGFDDALLAAATQEPPDSAAIFELFTRFHLRYMEAAGGERLRMLHDSVKPQAERYRRLYSGAPAGRVAASVAEHREIIDAIERGDGEGARAAVERNWKNAAERLAELIEQGGASAARAVAG